jgi:hypothetical protein
MRIKQKFVGSNLFRVSRIDSSNYALTGRDSYKGIFYKSDFNYNFYFYIKR